MALRAILFDLDGTLVQTREAVWQLFRQTNSAFGLGVDTREQFFDLFRGNFWNALDSLSPDPASAERVRGHFQQLLRQEYCPPLIPGMADIIKGLAAHYVLAVLSSNTMTAIRCALSTAGVAHCFAHVFPGDIEPDKSKAIGRFLDDPSYGLMRPCTPGYDETMTPPCPRIDDLMLVTDTTGDVAEAQRTGIRALGVAWGMHTEQELLDAGAEFVAIWPQELLSHLMPADAAAEDDCACESEATACSADGCETAASIGDAARPDIRRRRRLLAVEQQRQRLGASGALAIEAGARAVNAPDPGLLAALRRLQRKHDGNRDCTTNI